MDRVEVTISMIGLTLMQVCAIKDATDEEILQIANSENPAGTTNGWTLVIRENNKPDYWEDDTFEQAKPVQCEDHPDRMHFILVC